MPHRLNAIHLACARSVETWLGGGPDMKDSDYGFTKLNGSDPTPMNMFAKMLFPGQNVWGFQKLYNPGEASDHVLATIAIACDASSEPHPSPTLSIRYLIFIPTQAPISFSWPTNPAVTKSR
jgi:hypothetical protein